MLNRWPYTVLVCTLAVAAAAAAWCLPGRKEAAIVGRLNYPQFLLAVGTTALAISVLAMVLVSRPQRRTCLFRVLALWLGIGLALGLGELAAWAWPTRHLMDNPWYVGEQKEAEELPFLRPPHMKWTGLSRGDLAMKDGSSDPDARTVTFATDAEGFRNENETDQADIVFLGDSFTEAGNIPIDDIFPSLVGEQTGCTVRNFGIANFTAPTELIVLKKFALKYSPNTVVWQVAESNDLAEASHYAQWVRMGRPDFRRDPQGLPTHYQAWQRRSPTQRLFALLRNPKPWPLGGTFPDVTGKQHEVRFNPVLPGAEHSPAGHAGWLLMSSAFREGAQFLKARKIDLLIVLIPMKFRVMAESIEFDALMVNEGQQQTVVDRLPAEWDLPREQSLAFYLQQLCGEIGVRFVDTTPELRQHTAQGELVYLPMDTHLAPAGHQIVADLIVQAIGDKECGAGGAGSQTVMPMTKTN